jgi:hypothetical protein
MSKNHNEVLGNNVPHPDIVNGVQIGNVLNIIMALTPILVNPAREAENVPGKNAIDGESAVAASVTMIAACARLDAILADNSRWDTSFQKKLEANAEQIQVAQTRFLQTQTMAANEVITPHFRFRPDLRRLNEKEWTASIGEGNDAIMGIGPNPDAALRAFDDIFKGHVPLYMLNWLLQREAALDSGVPSPPAPINHETKRKQPVVRKGNQAVKRTARDGKNRRADRRDNETPLGGS